MFSPVASSESLLVTFLIDTNENRDVGTYEVHRAYLQTSLVPKCHGGRVLNNSVSKFVDILCEVNHKHKKNVVYDNIQKFLYMEIL